MNTIDLLQAVGEAADKDIQHAEKLSSNNTRKRPFWIGLAAAAAVFVFALLAVIGANEKKLYLMNQGTTAAQPDQTERTAAETVKPGQFVTAVTTDALGGFTCQNPYLNASEFKNVSLFSIRTEEGHRRQPVYMLNAAVDSMNEGWFISIRESVKEFRSQNNLIDQAEFGFMVRVNETEPTAGQELWLIPTTYAGGISGVYWVRYNSETDSCDITLEAAKPDEESWVRRFDMLGELAASVKPAASIRQGEGTVESNPVFLILDGGRLVALAGTQAFILKEDPAKTESAVMDLSAFLPTGKELTGVIWDLSSTTVLHYEKIVLTEAQKEKYDDILYSSLNDPYLERYDFSGMTEEELYAFMNEISQRQSRAAQAGSLLNFSALYSQSGGKVSYPEEYAGCYITGDKLTVCLPENVPGAKEWVEKIIPSYLHDMLIYRTVEHSYQELEELKEVVVKAVLDAGINIYLYSTSDSMNRIVIGVDAKQIVSCCELILEKGWEGSVMAESAGPNILQ